MAKKALLSVSDKTGLLDLAKGLVELGVELLSTGGTARYLREQGLAVTDVSDYTSFPELFEGRVKTLHPKIHGGMLFRRDNPQDIKDAAEHGIAAIDFLIVNLYPFQQTVAKPDVTLEEAIENIDIGGPAMLRAACKNYQSVTVIVDPADYPSLLAEMREHKGETTLATRECLAIKVFNTTAHYDSAIASYLNKAQECTKSYSINLPLAAHLRYGDNPHQRAVLYGSFFDYFKQLHGKELSYTNVLDIQNAAELIHEFERPTVAILKHTNPCGVGSDDDLREAWEKAFETDRQAPFGGVIVINRPMTAELARVIAEIFTDVIIAPEFETEARSILQKKKNLRLILMKPNVKETFSQPIIRTVAGGIMVMDSDPVALGLENLADKTRTQRVPTQEEIDAMSFGWKVAKHVKSNAIVFSTHDRTLAIGAGQMSRVDSCRIAVWKAKEAGLSLKGSAVASDAMFPFPDGLIYAAEAGATAAIQPGGSVKDKEVIDAANERGVAMVFTGVRHFLH